MTPFIQVTAKKDDHVIFFFGIARNSLPFHILGSVTEPPTNIHL